MKDQILDIFYNKIVKEAQTGRVDCFFMMNLIFNLNIENTLVSKCDDIEYDGVLIPTLKITNKELTNNLSAIGSINFPKVVTKPFFLAM